MQSSLKVVGASGQICLGKEHAGQMVLVEEDKEAGVWIIRRGTFVPDSERWLHAPEMKAKIDDSLRHMAENPPRETDLDELEARASARHGK